MNFLRGLSDVLQFVMLVTAIMLLVSIISKKERKSLNWIFLPYCLLSIADISSYYLFISIFKNAEIFQRISLYIQTSFIYVELLVIIIFYLKIISKYWFTVATVLIIPIAYTFSIYTKNYLGLNNEMNMSTFLIFFELTFIIFSFTIFTYLSFDNLRFENYQNTNNGFFIFITLTAPYYFLSNYIDSTHPKLTPNLYFINALGYSILFWCISKDLKWNK